MSFRAPAKFRMCCSNSSCGNSHHNQNVQITMYGNKSLPKHHLACPRTTGTSQAMLIMAITALVPVLYITHFRWSSAIFDVIILTVTLLQKLAAGSGVMGMDLRFWQLGRDSAPFREDMGPICDSVHLQVALPLLLTLASVLCVTFSAVSSSPGAAAADLPHQGPASTRQTCADHGPSALGRLPNLPAWKWPPVTNALFTGPSFNGSPPGMGDALFSYPYPISHVEKGRTILRRGIADESPFRARIIVGEAVD